MTSGKSVAHKAAGGLKASWVSAAGLFAAGLVLVVHAWAYDFVSDDAFIVARYAGTPLRTTGGSTTSGSRSKGTPAFYGWP